MLIPSGIDLLSCLDPHCDIHGQQFMQQRVTVKIIDPRQTARKIRLGRIGPPLFEVVTDLFNLAFACDFVRLIHSFDLGAQKVR